MGDTNNTDGAMTVIPAGGREVPVAVPSERLQMLDLKELATARRQFSEFVSGQLKRDVHFGAIPGTGTQGKPGKMVLLKPGAEEVVRLYMCSATYETAHTIENFETSLFLYRIKCRVVDGHGIERAQGDGSCSSYESKYRYRGGARLCPACSKATIKKSKYPPRGGPKDAPLGWYCYAKIGGCGAEFAHDDQAIVGQSEERVQNPDICDTQNTVLKMACKRALVAAAINLGCCSDMFTQDVEPEHAAPAADEPMPAWAEPPKVRKELATQFKERCDKLGLDASRIATNATGKSDRRTFTIDDLNACLRAIDAYEAQGAAEGGQPPESGTGG